MRKFGVNWSARLYYSITGCSSNVVMGMPHSTANKNAW
jgi:hypothetical protein